MVVLAVILVAVSSWSCGKAKKKGGPAAITTSFAATAPVSQSAATPVSIAAVPGAGLGMTDAVADQVILRMNQLLFDDEPNSGYLDVQCDMQIKRSGEMGDLADNLLGIADQTELAQALLNSADFKVVQIISWCGSYTTGTFNGCSDDDSSVVVSQHLSSNRVVPEARLWLHESGHVHGLLDATWNPSDLMYGAQTWGERINQNVCNHLRSP